MSTRKDESIYGWHQRELSRLVALRAVAAAPGSSLDDINDSHALAPRPSPRVPKALVSEMVASGELLEEDGRYWPALSLPQVDMKAQQYDERMAACRALGLPISVSTRHLDEALAALRSFRALAYVDSELVVGTDDEDEARIALALPPQPQHCAVGEVERRALERLSRPKRS